MIEAFSAADVRAAEEPLLAAERSPSGGLMDRAATALALTVRGELRALRGRVTGATVTGLVGPGNNGGDTLYALARLAAHGVRVTAVLTTATIHAAGLAALSRAGGRVLAVVDDAPGTRVWVGEALAEAFASDVVLDGLLGIGARGGLRGTAAEVVSLLAELCGAEEAPGGDGTRAPARPLVVAVDLPSGTGVDDGSLPGPVLPADVTVAFGVAKPLHLLPPADRSCGVLHVVDLGLRPGLAAQGREPAVGRLDGADAAMLWPVPTRAGHKYSRGVVGVVAGSPSYPGAAVLVAAGALGAGCGMVRHVADPAVTAAVVAAHPEVVTGQDPDVRVQAWVLGPGVAEDDDEQRGRAAHALAAAVRAGLPVVVDAGALHLLPPRVGPRVVLTPHAGELARLLEEHDVDVDREAVEAEPLRWAREAHRRTGATVLLKGATTVVVGDGVVLTQADAPAWLATAGAGDVLAGVLGAVLAGRSEHLVPGAGGGRPGGEGRLVARLVATAVLVHGRAAHRANPGGPVSAGEVARALPGTVAELLR